MAVTASLEQRVDRLAQTLPDFSWPRVFRLMRDMPIITPGQLSFQYGAIALAGGKQMAFADIDDAYIQVKWEALRDFDPQVILFCGRREEERERPRRSGCTVDNPPRRRVATPLFTGRWQELSAVRAGRLFSTPCSMLCRPGPGLVDGMEQLRDIFAAFSAQ
jgi:iron complex transport system substrate-binding protein